MEMCIIPDWIRNDDLLISALHHLPIHNLPQRLQVRGAAVLVVEVVGVFPDVEGEEGAEAVGDGIVGAGVLADGQGAGDIGLEPDPAGAEEAHTLGNEVFLEGLDGAPLLSDLPAEGRIRGKLIRLGRTRQDGRHPLPLRAPGHNEWDGRLELGKVQVVVQDLAGVVEDRLRFLDSACGCARNDNLLQRHGLVLRAGDEFVEVVHIGLQVLAVVEGQGLLADEGRQGALRIGKVD